MQISWHLKIFIFVVSVSLIVSGVPAAINAHSMPQTHKTVLAKGELHQEIATQGRINIDQLASSLINMERAEKSDGIVKDVKRYGNMDVTAVHAKYSGGTRKFEINVSDEHDQLLVSYIPESLESKGTQITLFDPDGKKFRLNSVQQSAHFSSLKRFHGSRQLAESIASEHNVSIDSDEFQQAVADEVVSVYRDPGGFHITNELNDLASLRIQTPKVGEWTIEVKTMAGEDGYLLTYGAVNSFTFENDSADSVGTSFLTGDEICQYTVKFLITVGISIVVAAALAAVGVTTAATGGAVGIILGIVIPAVVDLLITIMIDELGDTGPDVNQAANDLETYLWAQDLAGNVTDLKPSSVISSIINKLLGSVLDNLAAQVCGIFGNEGLQIITDSLEPGTVGFKYPYPSTPGPTDDKLRGYIRHSGGDGSQITYRVSLLNSLPPGLELDEQTGQVFGIPESAGNYDFNINIEDSNNVASKRIYMTVYGAESGSFVNLASAEENSGFSVSDSVISPGETITIQYKFVNKGDRSSGPFRYGIMFSEDSVIDETDVACNKIPSGNSYILPKCNNLKPQQALVGTTSFQIPFLEHARTYYFGLYADVGNVVTESNENDNTSFIPVVVDYPTRVTAPQQGDVLTAGSTTKVQWDYFYKNGDHNVGANVLLRLYKNGNYVATVGNSSYTPNDGEYDWNVPIGYEGDNFQIKVENQGDSNDYDFSGAFSIGSGGLTGTMKIGISDPSGQGSYSVTGPAGFTTISNRKTDFSGFVPIGNYTVSWQEVDGYNLGIKNLSGATKSNPYILTIGDGQTKGLNGVYVSSGGGATGTVTSPQAGEVLNHNSIKTINWTGVSGTKVDIELWQNGNFKEEIIDGTPNDGAFDWGIDSNSGSYQIKVFDWLDHSKFAVSGHFTIVGGSSGPDDFVISPSALDFSTNKTQLTVTVTNTGGKTVQYDATENSSWLQLRWSSSGSEPLAPGESYEFLAFADRTNLNPGQVYNTNITVTSDEGTTKLLPVTVSKSDTGSFNLYQINSFSCVAEPESIAVDSDYVYIANGGVTEDWNVYTKSGSVHSVKGISNLGDRSVAVGADGYIYYSNYDDNPTPERISVFTQSGSLVREFGNTRFSRIEGIDVKGSNVYVGDRGHHKVLRFSTSGSYLGSVGSEGTGDGQFDEPNDLAVAPNGNVYVLDEENERVQVFSSGLSFLFKFASKGTLPGQVSAPRNIAIDQNTGYVYITDTGQNCLHVFTADGNFVTKYSTNLSSPWGLGVDSDGTIYVGSHSSRHIYVLTTKSSSLTVKIDPVFAAEAGAQWSIDGGTIWHNSNDYIDGVAPGSYTLSFKSISGWITPGDQNITLIPGDHHSFTGTYTMVSNPTLSVSPLSIDFSTDSSLETFEISNSGTGLLNYTLGESLPWASLSSTGGSLASGQSETIYVSVDRSSMVHQQVYAGSVSVTSNGGNSNIALSATGYKIPEFALSTTSVLFSPDSASSSFDIINTGEVDLTFTLIESLDWLTLAPASGTITASASQTINVNIDRSAFVDGQVYSGSITLQTNAGEVSISVVANTISEQLTAPENISITPSAGTGSSQSFTALYRDPDGADDLTFVYLKINKSNANTQAAYVRYGPKINELRLRNDSGSGWLPGKKAGTTGLLENSQVKIDVSKVLYSTNGNDASLIVPMQFKQAFSGTKNIYLHASDSNKESSKWEIKGTYTVEFTNNKPTLVSLNPDSGSGTSETYIAVYEDGDGVSDLTNTYLKINKDTGKVDCVYLRFDNKSSKLYLRTDNGNSWISGIKAGTAGMLSNSQASINAANVRVNKTDNKLTLTIPVSFSRTFYGSKNVYMFAIDKARANSGWRKMGTFTVGEKNEKPINHKLTPTTGSGGWKTFTSIYKDHDGYGDLRYVYFKLAESQFSTTGVYVRYRCVTKKLDLRTTAGGSWVYGPVIGTNAKVHTRRVSINLKNVRVLQSGKYLTLILPLVFKSGFSGQYNTYMYCSDKVNNNSGWKQMGTFTVATPSPSSQNSQPLSSLNVTPGKRVFFNDFLDHYENPKWSVNSKRIKGHDPSYVFKDAGYYGIGYVDVSRTSQKIMSGMDLLVGEKLIHASDIISLNSEKTPLLLDGRNQTATVLLDRVPEQPVILRLLGEVEDGFRIAFNLKTPGDYHYIELRKMHGTSSSIWILGSVEDGIERVQARRKLELPVDVRLLALHIDNNEIIARVGGRRLFPNTFIHFAGGEIALLPFGDGHELNVLLSNINY